MFLRLDFVRQLLLNRVQSQLLRLLHASLCLISLFFDFFVSPCNFRSTFRSTFLRSSIVRQEAVCSSTMHKRSFHNNMTIIQYSHIDDSFYKSFRDIFRNKASSRSTIPLVCQKVRSPAARLAQSSQERYFRTALGSQELNVGTFWFLWYHIHNPCRQKPPLCNQNNRLWVQATTE